MSIFSFNCPFCNGELEDITFDSELDVIVYKCKVCEEEFI